MPEIKRFSGFVDKFEPSQRKLSTAVGGPPLEAAEAPWRLY